MNKSKTKKKIEKVCVCPSCGSANIVKQTKSAECYCGDCGLVLEEICSGNFY